MQSRIRLLHTISRKVNWIGCFFVYVRVLLSSKGEAAKTLFCVGML